MEVCIAPVAVYDGSGSRTATPSSPSRAIHAELEKHWFEGLMNFSLLSEKDCGLPVTIADANRICMTENSDYVIYGYLKKNEANWFAEIKLYSVHEKKIIKEFFAGDSLDHYERLMDNLCKNILCGMNEVTGLNHEELREKEDRPMELRIPASVFYWSPVDSDWGSRILGIAGTGVGLEFYPPQGVMVSRGKLVDLSLRLSLSWDIGINRSGIYPLILNTVAVSCPVLFHVHYDGRHSFYGGAGFAYSIELMSIRPKYEDEKFLYQNSFSFETVAGYELFLNEKVNVFTEFVFDWHLSGDGFVSVKPSVGASLNIFKERK